MELLQLHYFKTIADCQHITRAANQLDISQPSLSNTLSRIENELGVRLFDRQGRNIVLNDYGKIVLKHTNIILRELDNIRTEINDLEQRQDKVVAISSIDSYYVREWLPDFIKKNPDLIVRHAISSNEAMETSLLNGNIDFAISSDLLSNPDLDHLPLWEDAYVVLAPLDFPMDAQTPHDFAEFADEPFVALPAANGVFRSIDVLSKAAGFRPNIVFEGERTLLEDVFLPIGALLIVMKSTIRTEEDRRKLTQFCKIIELCNPEARINVNLFWDKQRYLPAAAQRLVQYIQSTPIQAWHLGSSNPVAQRE